MQSSGGNAIDAAETAFRREVTGILHISFPYLLFFFIAGHLQIRVTFNEDTPR